MGADEKASYLRFAAAASEAATEGAMRTAGEQAAAALGVEAADAGGAAEGPRRLQVTWLGTSSGAPTQHRNVSSVAYRLPEGTFLIDCGEGTCRQVQAAGIDPATIRRLLGGRRRMRDEHSMPLVEGLTWTLPAALGVTVVAAQLEHRVPCWGYVLQEHDPPARPDHARMAELHVSAAAVEEAVNHGGPDAPVQLPSGQALPTRKLMSPPWRGRKVVLLGDTCNSEAIVGPGAGADLLSHEATFSREMGAKARIAQHSTSSMAGAFARRLGAQQLVLTHFSSRFMERKEDSDVGDVRKLRAQAARSFGSHRVMAATDLYTVDVPAAKPGETTAPLWDQMVPQQGLSGWRKPRTEPCPLDHW
ncbi:hypothetical protein WJX81_007988 [Elliptochloris bilobata]|uniref:Uncharacterized protein n=1 Tax=Elliptochloris bilobata TaxID=381761 RepID=A0AAW1QW01_9CHLO